MEKIEKELLLEDEIIAGDVARELKNQFSELHHSFRQRKNYDEYYYDTTKVSISLDDIKNLVYNDYVIEINHSSILIKY